MFSSEISDLEVATALLRIEADNLDARLKDVQRCLSKIETTTIKISKERGFENCSLRPRDSLSWVHVTNFEDYLHFFLHSIEEIMLAEHQKTSKRTSAYLLKDGSTSEYLAALYYKNRFHGFEILRHLYVDKQIYDDFVIPKYVDLLTNQFFFTECHTDLAHSLIERGVAQVSRFCVIKEVFPVIKKEDFITEKEDPKRCTRPYSASFKAPLGSYLVGGNKIRVLLGKVKCFI